MRSPVCTLLSFLLDFCAFTHRVPSGFLKWRFSSTFLTVLTRLGVVFAVRSPVCCPQRHQSVLGVFALSHVPPRFVPTRENKALSVLKLTFSVFIIFFTLKLAVYL